MKTVLRFPIFCYERELCLKVKKSEYASIHTLLETVYCEWMDDTDSNGDYVGCICVEEYLMMQLEKAGYQFKEMKPSFLVQFVKTKILKIGDEDND